MLQDWDATIGKAIQSNRVLLLKNVDPELHSEDLAEALTEHMKTRCEVRIAPPLSFSYRTSACFSLYMSFLIDGLPAVPILCSTTSPDYTFR